ncbi:MAG: nucleoside deaminase [Alphaproteobacteria bacterium]|nr:nucleoside deaminase [Alphaproteobacteria bacterium]
MDDSLQHEDFMRRALALAQENVNDGAPPYGAVVVHNGEIIGEGRNMVHEKKDPSAHAEILAIRQAAQHLGQHRLETCTIYASCEPCPMCLNAIRWARLKKFTAAHRLMMPAAQAQKKVMHRPHPVPYRNISCKKMDALSCIT